MTVLLIDNYDSYTFNLAELVYAVTGEEPLVLKVDLVTDRDIEAASCVIVSPGPGHPKTEQALIACFGLLVDHKIPTLGVCLGHQAIVTAFGGEVSTWEPAHGELSAINHSGEGIFNGISSPFNAVRYHSLGASHLPSCLVVDARTATGDVMAVRHESLPFYGVQFHPESVLSEHGNDILRNFFALVARAEEKTQQPAPDISSVVRTTSPAYPSDGRKRITVNLPWVEPSLVVPRFIDGHPRAFWLDSSMQTPWSGRYSVAGILRDEDVSVSFDADARTCREYKAGSSHVTKRHIFDYLEDSPTTANEDDAFPFSSGWVGFFGYACGDLEARPSQGPEPDALFMRANTIIVFDHVLKQVSVHGHSNQVEMEAERFQSVVGSSAETAARVSHMPDATVVGKSSGRDAYHESFTALQAELRAGNTYEALLAFQLTMDSDADPLAAYMRLRRANPAPYAGYFRHENLYFLASSPERFMAVDDARHVQSKPIKGTVPRGDSAQEDALNIWRLSHESRFQRENLMIVDLVRNDLSVVCEPGTVHVSSLMNVETYASVHQLVTTIDGKLRGTTSTIDAIKALFPPGSMTGAPKKRTMEIINRIEPEPRGAYGGAFGWLSDSGSADFSVVIRTMTAQPPLWKLGVGGGIIVDADPMDELEEAMLKGQRVASALRTTT